MMQQHQKRKIRMFVDFYTTFLQFLILFCEQVEADAKVTHDNATTNPSESNSSVTDSVEDTSYENFLADLPTEYPDALVVFYLPCKLFMTNHISQSSYT